MYNDISFVVFVVLSSCSSLFGVVTTRPAPATCPAGFAVSIEKVPFCDRPLSMLRIPAGNIEMPTTRPGAKTEVVEVKSIWMGMTEITWEQYGAWASSRDLSEEEAKKARGSSRPASVYCMLFEGGDLKENGSPAQYITYSAAQMYCRWLSEKTSRKYRLPTEAEWEYACRMGGSPSKLGSRALDEVAWFAGNTEDADEDPAPRRVANKQPNEWGLYDMLGNVAEWCMGFDGKPVLKGGSFEDEADKVQSAARALYDKSWQMRDPGIPKNAWWLIDAPFAGFRIVRED